MMEIVSERQDVPLVGGTAVVVTLIVGAGV